VNQAAATAGASVPAAHDMLQSRERGEKIDLGQGVTVAHRATSITAATRRTRSHISQRQLYEKPVGRMRQAAARGRRKEELYPRRQAAASYRSLSTGRRGRSQFLVTDKSLAPFDLDKDIHVDRQRELRSAGSRILRAAMKDAGGN